MARGLRVLHAIPSLSLVHGGPSYAMGLIARSIAGVGIQCDVVTTNDDGPGRRGPSGAVQGYDGRDGRCWYLPKTFDIYKYCHGFPAWLSRHIEDYDILHSHALFSHLPIAACRAAMAVGMPFVIRPLGTLSNYGIKQRRPILKRLSLAMVEAPLLRAAAAVHFTSDRERIEAESLRLPMRSAVIPLAVEEGATTDRSGRSAISVLFLSRLHPVKNLDSLLIAWATCSTFFPQARLRIAGDGDAQYVQSLKGLAKSLSIEGSIEWLGLVEGDEKRRAFDEADVFVLPSHSENFGIAVAEAMRAGLPIVLGEGVALAALVQEAGAGLVVKSDPGSIADALRRFMADPVLRVETGVRARALAGREFSLRAMGERLESLYTSILSSRHRTWDGGAAVG